MSEEPDRRLEFEAEAMPHMDALYSTALSMTRNRIDADDLVQETYLKAWRFWDKYTAGTSCKAWLYTIMTNTYINLYRKKVREPSKADYDELAQFGEMFLDSTVKELSDPEAELFDGLLGDEVQAAIESLPEYFRMVLVLSDVQGLSYQEVAEIVGVPIGTARSRLSRARGQMQQLLRDFAIESGVLSSGDRSKGQEDDA